MTGQSPNLAVISSYEGWPNEKAATVAVGSFGFLTVFLIVSVLISLVEHPSWPAGSKGFEAALSGALLALVFGATWYEILSAVKGLDLTADTLRWRTLLRSHEVPLAELRRVRPKGRKGRVEVIEFARRRPIRLGIRDGLVEFAADIKAAAPQVEVTFADQPSGNRPNA
jgi:hypothetical protein